MIVAPRCEEASLQFLKSLQTPAVLVAYRPEDPELSFIDLDNRRAAQMIVEHFVSKGHKRIAYVGGELELNANARDRYQGYLDGMKEAGLRVDPRWAHNKVFDAFFGAEALSRFLACSAPARLRRSHWLKRSHAERSDAVMPSWSVISRKYPRLNRETCLPSLGQPRSIAFC